ncbi:MAG: PH domain-containing protein [Planctomycetales bacterium]|nr:PH domain-containing protein [Planctomycetales bacterium]
MAHDFMDSGSTDGGSVEDKAKDRRSPSDPRVGIPLTETSKQLYSGVWGVLSSVFRVPQEPPSLPHFDGAAYEAFKPSPGFLNYLRLQFVSGLIVAGVLLLIGVGSISVANFLAGVIGLPLAIAIEVASAIIGLLAVHLRYDTTWYVLNDRSLRVRRGIWVIHETTITFENIQNVRITQGPIQRLFGISTLVVETAGGGKMKPDGSADGHTGLIEGIANPDEIRSRILARTAQRKHAIVSDSGLGDDPIEALAGIPAESWSPEHVELLTEIRGLIYGL